MSDREPRTDEMYVAVPERGSGPGVLVLHAWWGLTPVFKDVCDRLARAGFVAIAPDLYGGLMTDTIEEAERLVNAAEGEATRVLVLNAAAALRNHPAVRGNRIAAIGFSMGAAWALDLSLQRPDEIAAVTVFYGTWERDYSGARAAYLGHFAADDPYEPREAMQGTEAALRAVGRAVTFYHYPGTKHWFFEPNRPEYDQAAATLAWDRTLAFLRQQLESA